MPVHNSRPRWSGPVRTPVRTARPHFDDLVETVYAEELPEREEEEEEEEDEEWEEYEE